jgi:LuxR family maltose regulon positive regulatory protein
VSDQLDPEPLTAQFAHASTRSEFDLALEQLRAEWPELASEHGSRIRTMLDATPNELWERDPWLVAAYAASHRSLDSTATSAALPYFAIAEAAVDDTTSVLSVVALRAHHAAALRSLGRFDEALALLEPVIDDALAVTSAPLAWRITLEARSSLQLGVIHYHLGDYDRARACLRLTEGLADRGLLRSERVECFAALSMLEYVMGDFASAQRYAELARVASGASGLLESRFGAAAIVVEVLIAVEQDRLQDALDASVLAGAAAVGSDWEPLALYAEAATAIISERYVEGLDLLRRSLQLWRAWPTPGGITTMVEGLRATMLLRLGETDAAWDILLSLQPTQHHANCPGRFVSHLRLITGDIAGALAALRDCDALGDAHSSRTLVDVLLIKGAANYMLGSFASSDVAVDRGLLLAGRNGVRIPFRLIPTETMDAMLARAVSRTQPADVEAILVDARGGGTSLSPRSALSEREREIVQLLARHRSVAAIAEELFISVNTVKSHVKSAYRKLDVTSRPDAIRRARELGLHLDLTRP